MAVINVATTDNFVSKINTAQPGDVVQFASGTHTAPGGAVTVTGAASKRITIRGAGYLASTIDGNDTQANPLQLDDCSYVTVENLVFTNDSGVDGQVDYSASSRGTNRQGLRISNGSDIYVRDCMFKDISTRGILITNGGSDVTVQYNLFVRVGDDTSSADIAVSSDGPNVTAKYNLMCGYVDGFLNDGAGNPSVSYNIIGGHIWENCVDLKAVTSGGGTIQQNVIYGHNIVGNQTVQFQNGTSNIMFRYNIVRGKAKGAGSAIKLIGDTVTCTGNQILGNLIDAYGSDGQLIQIISQDNTFGVESTTIKWNLLNRGDDSIVFENIALIDGVTISLNVFNSPLSKAVNIGSNPQNVSGTQNVYTSVSPTADAQWTDSDPTTGPHVLDSNWRLDSTSPGYSDGAGIPDIPSAITGGIVLPSLESHIIDTIRDHHSLANVRECLNQAEIPYAIPGGSGSIL